MAAEFYLQDPYERLDVRRHRADGPADRAGHDRLPHHQDRAGESGKESEIRVAAHLFNILYTNLSAVWDSIYMHVQQ